MLSEEVLFREEKTLPDESIVSMSDPTTRRESSVSSLTSGTEQNYKSRFLDLPTR